MIKHVMDEIIPQPTTNDKDPKFINLAEWMPWQNRQQTTHIVGHSVASVNFVLDAEFIELQSKIVLYPFIH